VLKGGNEIIDILSRSDSIYDGATNKDLTTKKLTNGILNQKLQCSREGKGDIYRKDETED
jgi:hypothetical protein